MNTEKSAHKIIIELTCKNKAVSHFAAVVILMSILPLAAIANPLSSELGESDYRVFASDSSDTYTVVDQMPEIEGGLNQIYEHIQYPKEAKARGIEGRVFIKFIVTKEGNVESPEILRDIGSGCGEAAVNGIKKVKFTPGVHQGQPVRVYYTMPINFNLD